MLLFSNLLPGYSLPRQSGLARPPEALASIPESLIEAVVAGLVVLVAIAITTGSSRNTGVVAAAHESGNKSVGQKSSATFCASCSWSCSSSKRLRGKPIATFNLLGLKGKWGSEYRDYCGGLYRDCSKDPLPTLP